MKARIFDIQRFSVNDGPGIRTTVFFKGCPLRCAWCHNPESKDPQAQMRFTRAKCVSCRACETACPNGCHTFTDERSFRREACAACGLCAAVCPAEALELVGTEKDTGAILETVLRDRPFYQSSGGGVTFSGGEPLMQYDALYELAALCKDAGLHTALETSGFFGDESKLLALAERIDLFLFDCKETDPERHARFTGAPNDAILRNLGLLDGAGARIILRCPLVPGWNARNAHLLALAEIANAHPHIEAIEIEPYHPLGRDKAAALDMPYPPGDLPFASDDEAEGWLTLLRAHTDKPVRRA